MILLRFDKGIVFIIPSLQNDVKERGKIILFFRQTATVF